MSDAFSILENFGEYECYRDGEHFINGITTNFSYQCCEDTRELLEANNGTLKTEAVDCLASLMTEFSSDDFVIDYCNSDVTQCTIDYAEFECGDEFLETCTSLGGMQLEADVEVVCTGGIGRITFVYQNLFDCTTSSCSEQDYLAVLRASTAAISNNDPSLECMVEKIDNVRVAGSETGFSWQPEGVSNGGSMQGGTFALVLAAIASAAFSRVVWK